MSRNKTTNVDRLWEAARRRLPEFSSGEQRAGIVLLKELARGQPLRAAQLADAQLLWTWGAVTGLFLPELLREPARVESRDPESSRQPCAIAPPPGRTAGPQPHSTTPCGGR